MAKTQVVCVLCLLTSGLARGEVRAADTPPEAHVRFPPGPKHIWVSKAVEGAVRRLSNPVCHEVLSDFSDARGHTLVAGLAIRGQTLSTHLHELWFLDGRDQPQCARNSTDAFTVPGWQTIFVCPGVFRRPVGRGQEILVIHEILHTLGLGENPPASDQITRQVERRCAGV